MTVKKTTKKKVPAAKNMNEAPIPMHSKLIGIAILLFLVGGSIFWFVGKSKITHSEGAYIKRLEKEGYTIDKEDASFSGFPFSLTATYPSLRVIKDGEKGIGYEIYGDNVEVSTVPWRPTRATITGPLRFSVTAKGSSVLSLRLGRLQLDFSLGKDDEVKIEDWKVFDVDVLRADKSGNVVSVGSLSMKRIEKAEGDLTKVGTELELEKVVFPGKERSDTDVVIDELSLEAHMVTPFKTADSLSEAVQSFNKKFNEDLKKRCQENAQYMPPLQAIMKEIEESKSRCDMEVNIRGGKYGVHLKFDAQVKDAFPQATLAAKLENMDNLLESAVEGGFLTPAISRAVQLGLSSIGDRDDDKDIYNIKILLEDKKCKIQDKVIWEMKEPDWDHLPLPKDYCGRLLEQDKKAGGAPTAASLMSLGM